MRSRPSRALIAGTIEHDGHSGWTPLHLAVAAGQCALVEQLAAAGADSGPRRAAAGATG
jgi:hypothetical protein